MEKCRHQLGRRATMMVAGILLIGISVGLLRLAAFGVDPFSCMNMGISGFLGMSFGNWQLIANILLLIVVFFTARSFIGLGTVVNMVFVGYIADFVCWLAQDAGMESSPCPAHCPIAGWHRHDLCGGGDLYGCGFGHRTL